jgi:hypothetical protein
MTTAVLPFLAAYGISYFFTEFGLRLCVVGLREVADGSTSRNSFPWSGLL